MAPDTLGSLAGAGVEISAAVLGRDLDSIFRSDDRLRSVVVDRGPDLAKALINRASFYEAITGPRGYGWALFSGKPIEQILPEIAPAIERPADAPIVETGIELLNSESLAADDDILIRGPDGSASSLAVSALLAAVARSYASAVDAIASTERRFRALVQESSDIIALLDSEQRIVYMSEAVEKVMGYKVEDRIGQSAYALMHADDVETLKPLVASLMDSPGSHAEVSFRVQRYDGQWRWMEGTARNLLHQEEVQGVVVNLRDVTQRRALQDELRHQAFHDSLTGLPNRVLINDRADQMLARSRRESHACAAMLVDLDSFKDVNDMHGHSVGDSLLSLVAERLRLTLRSTDTVGRIGGDEFVVLVDGDSLDAGPEVVAERILDAFRAPFYVNGRSLSTTASIGVAVGLREDVDELLRDADVALYRAKSSGRNRHAVFNPGMKEALELRTWLAADLPGALERREFVLHYQPVFSLLDGSITSVEALLRWQHPERGLIAPGDFVQVLEETGLVVPVGRWVLEESCRMAAQLERHGHPACVSVNVSARQLDDESGLHDDVVHALSASNVNPRSLMLEITESTLMRDAEATARHLRRLKRLGVGIAIDDFGTGYSSLSYLAAFPVDSLKVDRSFIANLGRSSEADALLRSVLNLGQALSLTTVAEGIENDAQLSVLREQGCDQGQGFRLARPQPGDILLRTLANCFDRSPV